MHHSLYLYVQTQFMYVSHVHEDHSSDETESLTVASLLVRDGVAMEDVGQCSLAPGSREIGV